MVLEGFGVTGRLASVGGLLVLYTDNDTRNWISREEREWREIVYHMRWTLGDNRQLLWGCGQIDWQVDKNAWETFSLQVHYQRMTSTSTCKRIYYCMTGRKSCGYLVWSLSVSDLHCCHFIRPKPKETQTSLKPDVQITV